MEGDKVINEDTLIKMAEELFTCNNTPQEIVIITNGMTKEEIQHIKDFYNIKD